MIKVLEKAERINKAFNRYLARSIGGVILIIIALTLIDVTGRFAFNRPLPGSTELTSVCLAYVAFNSYAYGMIINSYVRVEVIFQRLPRRWRIVIELLTGVVGAFSFYIMFYGGYQLFMKSFLANELMTSSITFPYWIPKFFIPFGSALLIIQCALHCLRQIADFRASGEKKGGDPQ